MLKRYSNNFTILSIVLDWLFITLALLLAVKIRPALGNYFPWVRDYSPHALPTNWLYLVIPIVWIGVFVVNSVYDPEKLLTLRQEIGAVFNNSIYAAVTLAGLLYLWERDISRWFFVIFIIMSLFLLVNYRLILRVAAKHYETTIKHRNRILIAGAGPVGQGLAKSIIGYRDLAYQFIGYIDDNHDLQKSNKKILGTLDEISEVVSKYEIDNVIIALPRNAHERTTFLISKLHILPVQVWVIPDYFALTLSQAKAAEFAGIPMINLRAPVLSHYQRTIKRVFDLLVGIPFLVLVSPLFLIITLLIRFSSPGPIFYLSKRIKENGEMFGMIKFRTMVMNADQLLNTVIKEDENGNINHKRSDDPRITKIGLFLRKSSLDELPQLFNVIRGDMSLVGPRPELPEFVDRYELWQRKRFTVPQGMTGWWQVNGRSDKPMHLNTEDDIYYIQHYSIWLDIKILAKTILVVLRAKGAY